MDKVIKTAIIAVDVKDVVSGVDMLYCCLLLYTKHTTEIVEILNSHVYIPMNHIYLLSFLSSTYRIQYYQYYILLLLGK